MHRIAALIVCVLCGTWGFAQSAAPSLYSVVGGEESLPLRLMAMSHPGGPHSKNSRPAATPCEAGGAAGNFTIVLNCDGNDSDGSSSYGLVPDTDLAVGDQYYVQTVDDVFTIYNKADGSVVEGPDALTSFWTGFHGAGGSCITAGAGDDFIIRFDKAADRWVAVLPIFQDAMNQYWLCLAVSTSPDPTGTYYQFAVSQNGQARHIWDYPKLGVWTDGYYVGFNMLSPKPAYLGPRACALDRASMLQGLKPAPMQCFSKTAPADSFMLPSDISGGVPPIASEPAYFLDIAQPAGGVFSSLNLWQFHVDFTNSMNSTFTGPTVLPVNNFSEGSGFVPEPHKGALYSRSDRLMVPLAWRQTPDGVEHLLANDAIFSSGATTEQWFDIVNPNSAPAVAQQGTLVPDPGDNFWMGSLNMDKDGNLALGFSNASPRIDPGILFTGRLSTDPLDSMEGVQTVIAGSGYQNGPGNAWGDHSEMAVDPSDDCTFWYSSEYYTATNTGTDTWSTRVIAFKFTTCQ